MHKYKLFFFNDNNRLWAIDSEFKPYKTLFQDDRGNLANSFLKRYSKGRRSHLLFDIGDRIKRTPKEKFIYSNGGKGSSKDGSI